MVKDKKPALVRMHRGALRTAAEVTALEAQRKAAYAAFAGKPSRTKQQKLCPPGCKKHPHGVRPGEGYYDFDPRTLSDTELVAAVRATGGDPNGRATVQDFAKGASRPNDLPQQPHGDSLRDELADVLGMLSDACADFSCIDLATVSERNRHLVRSAQAQVTDARALLLSILGTRS